MALKKCRECGERVSSKASSCPYCGAPVKKKSSPWGCLVLLVLVGGCLWLNGRNGGGNAVAPRGTPASPGDVTTLRTDDGRGVIPVAVSQTAFDRYTELSVAGDETGMKQMMIQGSVGVVPNGTRCRVIASGIFTYEVRLTEGKFEGDAVFVASDWVGRK